MSFFGFGKKKEQSKSRKRAPSQTIRVINGEPAVGAKWDQSSKKEENDLFACGVNIGQFTMEKARTDAQSFVDTVIPAANGICLRFDDAVPVISFQPLTASGKVPKNVARASLKVDEVFISESIPGVPLHVLGDSIICYIGYLASGEVNSIVYHFWHAHMKHSVDVRNFGGNLRIVKIRAMRKPGGNDVVIFKDDVPSDNIEALEKFESSMNACLRK